MGNKARSSCHAELPRPAYRLTVMRMRHVTLLAPLATVLALVVAGCAILEAILDIWPARQLGVADRGIREGILRSLMARDGYVL